MPSRKLKSWISTVQMSFHRKRVQGYFPLCCLVNYLFNNFRVNPAKIWSQFLHNQLVYNEMYSRCIIMYVKDRECSVDIITKFIKVWIKKKPFTQRISPSSLPFIFWAYIIQYRWIPFMSICEVNRRICLECCNNVLVCLHIN